MLADIARKEFGDFQTPLSLARQICVSVGRTYPNVATIIEPTCGKGSFVLSALETYACASEIIGFDINQDYLDQAKASLQNSNCIKSSLQRRDFFKIDWEEIVGRLREPILFIGNPPWITNAGIGALKGANLPEKRNFQKLSGIDAKTGKSNFDISEYMLIKIAEALRGKSGMMAMIVKSATARKFLLHAWKHGLCIHDCRFMKIDAKKEFGASVDAGVLICRFDSRETATGARTCSIYDSLMGELPAKSIGYDQGTLIANAEKYLELSHLSGSGAYRWRSGIKHDCSLVMELKPNQGGLINGLGQKVSLEDDYLYPLYKSSDIANGRTQVVRRHVIVTQKTVGDNTGQIAINAPRTWAYLKEHEQKFRDRKSSIYKNRADFAIFGVGPYSFAPWKVAISGLYKKLEFCIVPPGDEKPSMVDDTVYFLPCDSAEEARIISEILNSEVCREFYSSFIFWDSKRPITFSVLNQLDLIKAAKHLNMLPRLARCMEKKRGMATPDQMELDLGNLIRERKAFYGATYPVK